MSDHPIFIPTSIGPIGGMVSEPEGERRFAAILLSGGNGRRFGVNQVWSNIGWDLAAMGCVTLRADYPGGFGDSIMSETQKRAAPFGEVATWFRRESGDLELLLIGACFGGRLAAVIGSRMDGIRGVGLIVPMFRPRKGNEPMMDKVRRRVSKQLGRQSTLPVEPRLVEVMAQAIERTTVWSLVGERDHRSRSEITTLRAALRKDWDTDLNVDEVPGVLLHGQPSLEAQRVTRERVVAWAGQVLDLEVVSP
jgi:dienelactone hydrolase